MNHFCRQASRLSSDAFERPLRLIERVKLNIHLLICASCRHYAYNLRLLHNTIQAMRGRSAAQLSTERKQVIIACCHADQATSDNAPNKDTSNEDKL
jgi:hypothetical protein